MVMKKYIFITLAALMAAVSCKKEMAGPVGAEGDALVFRASFEQTKTIYDGAHTTTWAAGNVVKVFDTKGASDSYTIENDCSDFEFTTTKLGSGPYYSIAGNKDVMAATTFNASSKQFNFPMGTSFDGSFDAADVLVCKSEGTDLFFHHSMAVMEFKVPSARKVEFSAKGAFAQSVNLTFNAEGESVVTGVSTSDNLTINAQKSGAYYFPVLPKVYAEGFSFKTTKPDNTVAEYPYTKSIEFKAGHVIGAGQLGSPYEIDENGRATVQISGEGYLEVYYANKQNSKCVILYPGGGYSSHSAGGIESVIQAMKGTDVTLIVDYFTLPSQGSKRAQAITDAEKAIDLAWENKDIWGGYTKVGVIGNSAGGHLAGYMGQMHHDKVDFQILIYPVVTLEEGKTHAGTRQNWLGNNPSQELTDQYCNEKHVTLSTPPTYLSYSTYDGTVPQDYNGKVMGEALRAIGHKHFEEHVYNDSSHSVNTWPDWPAALYTWLGKLDNPDPDPVDPWASWTDITASYAAANNINFGSNITMYKTEQLNGFAGNVGYIFKVPAGQLDMKVAEKWNVLGNNQRKISQTVNALKDYVLFLPIQGPAVWDINGGSTWKYYSPLAYGPNSKGETVVLRANDGFDGSNKAYAPALGVKNGKAYIKPAGNHDGKIYSYSDIQGNGEAQWDVEAAANGMFLIVKDGQSLIAGADDASLNAYNQAWRKYPNMTQNLSYTWSSQPMLQYDKLRNGRVIVGCTAAGDLIILVAEKFVNTHNQGQNCVGFTPNDNGHNGVGSDTRGLTMYESAKVMAELGCSDAMTMEDLNWSYIVLQDGSERGKDLFWVNCRWKTDGTMKPAADEYDNLVTICIK